VLVALEQLVLRLGEAPTGRGEVVGVMPNLVAAAKNGDVLVRVVDAGERREEVAIERGQPASRIVFSPMVMRRDVLRLEALL